MSRIINDKRISGLHRRMFFTAFITAAFTEFISVIALMIDSVIVCNSLGEKEIAAVGIASPFFFLSGIPATCLAAGLQTQCSQKMGRGKTEEVNQLFREIFTFTAVFMAVVTLIVFFGAPQLAYIFGARGNSAELKTATIQYLHGLAFDAAPYVLMSVTIPAVILDNGNRTVMISSVIGGIVNISFDLIAVNNGWGLFGVGFASALSAIISLLVLLTHFRGKNNIISLGLARLHLENIIGTIHMGCPNAIHSVAGVLRAAILNSLVVSVGGSIGMSVLTIHNSIIDFADIIAVGIAGAVGVISGIAYGEINGEAMEKTSKLAGRYILTISAVSLSVVLIFEKAIAGIFLDESSSGYELLLFVLKCIAAGTLFGAVIYSRVSYLQATEKVRSAQLLEAGSNLIVFLISAFVLSKLFGIRGLFAAFPISKAAVVIGCCLKYAFKSRKLLPGHRVFLDLDKSFFSESKDLISDRFYTVDDCVISSAQIHLFCKEHALSKRTAYMASLCSEEVMTNIIYHGGKIPKNRPPELRVTISGERLIIYIRDCGLAFNLNSIAKTISEEGDPFRNIGLKLICASAEEISYYRIYGMNTTIIKV